MRIAFDSTAAALPGRAFGLPGATTSAVQAGAFVGDVRRGGSCNCETHVITPHGDAIGVLGSAASALERFGIGSVA